LKKRWAATSADLLVGAGYDRGYRGAKPQEAELGLLLVPSCYTASVVKKYILILSLFLAVPAFSEKAKAPTPEEMRLTIKNLEETVVEQEERLRIHKLEIEALRKTVQALESRLASLEQGSNERRTTSSGSVQH
jgi:hypothetical protein